MFSNASSMSAAMANTLRDKSHQNNTLRSRSQPASDNHSSYFTPSTPSLTNPMKNFFGNLLHLTPHRHVSTLNTIPTRSKITSSLSTIIPSDRSSRARIAHPSIVSSLSIHSTIVQSPHEIQVYT